MLHVRALAIHELHSSTSRHWLQRVAVIHGSIVAFCHVLQKRLRDACQSGQHVRSYSLFDMMRGPTLSPVSLLCFTWDPSHMGNCKQQAVNMAN